MIGKTQRPPSALLGKLMQINWWLVWLVLAVGAIGIAMMVSAGGGEMHPWGWPTLIRFIGGFVLMLAVAIIPIQLLMRYAYLIYFLCLAMLIAVDIAGHIGMGAQRWVSLGAFNLQPSELMKLAVILALARYFHGMRPENMGNLFLLILPLLLVAMPAALILRQPNLGTTTILVGIAGIMFFMAGVYLRYFIIIIVVVMAALPIGWEFLHDYQRQRVLTFLEPEKDPLGSGYNIMQSMIAIGSGEMFGKGYLQGSQGQLDFLPEKQTDFIFTMLAEELGFVGSATTLLLYVLILVTGIAIAIRSRNTFGSLLAIGVTSLLFIHLWINVAMVMGLIPVVGVPLPLLSYGGSILITMMIGFGLLLNAYVHRDVHIGRGLKEGL